MNGGVETLHFVPFELVQTVRSVFGTNVRYVPFVPTEYTTNEYTTQTTLNIMALVETMDVEDGEPWVVDHLYYGARAEDQKPDASTLKWLIKEYHKKWFNQNVTPQSVGACIFATLNIQIDQQGLTWEYIMHKFRLEYICWRKMDRWSREAGIMDDGEIRQMLDGIQKLYHLMKTYLITNNATCARMRNGLLETLPEENRLNANGDNDPLITDTDKSKLNSWQDSFLRLRFVLCGENFRRAGNFFLTRSVTASNIETQAFEQAIEIVHFINENTRYDDNYQTWLVHTASAGTHDQMIRYMTDRPLAEAPDIEENCHLRSYEGDAFGRGAVIYDAARDMAWPYTMRSEWPYMEKRVNEIRKIVFKEENGKKMKTCRFVVAPTPEDVCVVHMKSAFRYDTFTETEELVQGNEMCFLQRVWYQATEFECYATEYMLKDYRLIAYMQRAFADGSDDESGVWGRSWQRAAGGCNLIGSTWKRFNNGEKPNGKEIECDELASALRNGRVYFNDDEVASFCDVCNVTEIPSDAWINTDVDEYYIQTGMLHKLAVRDSNAFTKLERFPLSDDFLSMNVLDNIPITESHCVKNTSGELWVPLYSQTRKCRFRMDMETWVALGGTYTCVHYRSFVVVKPYTGQRWKQVASPPDEFEFLSIPDAIGDTLRVNLFQGESCLPPKMADTLTLIDAVYVHVHGLFFVHIDNGCTHTRYMRVHTGRNWRDCPTPQFDKIYDSQKFGMHDKFMLWAQKGRTLFMVHEFDTYQTTFIIIGYGGTGKSTIMNVMQKFWPVHLRGILSSNIEQKFGMSQVLNKGKARAIYCNEVSGDLQLVQEEWQTSCSGEEGSFAVKHGAPWVGTCKAHHFWVGNGFPKHWKNQNNQVSRRLCGVLMDTPIQPRDGNVMEEIDQIIDVVQRKMVLAYFDMVEQYGATDPMSRPERLPPAFHSFYNFGRGQSNPVETFIDESNGTLFKIDHGIDPQWNRGLIMETHVFRDLYLEWRVTSEAGKTPKVSHDDYMPPLRERGVSEINKAKISIRNGEGHDDYTITTSNILTGIALCNVEPPKIVRD